MAGEYAIAGVKVMIQSVEVIGWTERTPRAERRWKKRQAEKERKRIDQQRLAEIHERIHDWSDSDG